MFVIPVIDLQGGLVVRGIAGRRAEYRPIKSQIVESSTPGAVAMRYVQHFGFKRVYVADLDAIAGDEPDISSYSAISSCGMIPLIDAGIGEAKRAQRLLEASRQADLKQQTVIALESIGSLEALSGIHAVLQPAETLFSFDLKAGRPIARADVSINQSLQEFASHCAQQVVSLGMHALIVLDLADVGTGQGTSTLGLINHLHAEFPALKIIAGGGVRGVDDLCRLEDAGCYAALVASALHDRRITAADLGRFREAASPPS